MANLDEDIYQRQGTEHDTPDPMVPDKPGWWWDGDIPRFVYAITNGLFANKAGDGTSTISYIFNWRGPCLKQRDMDDALEQYQTVQDAHMEEIAYFKGQNKHLCGQIDGCYRTIARLKEQLESGQHPAQDAPGPAMSPDPDTKRRDDHAAWVKYDRASTAWDIWAMCRGYITSEEYRDEIIWSIEKYLDGKEKGYTTVWDHATKHAIEKAELEAGK